MGGLPLYDDGTSANWVDQLVLVLLQLTYSLARRNVPMMNKERIS